MLYYTLCMCCIDRSLSCCVKNISIQYRNYPVSRFLSSWTSRKLMTSITLLKIKSTSILFNAALNNAIVSRGISSLKLSEISSNESGKNWKTKICQTEKKQIQSIISTNYALYFAVSFVSWRLADRYGELILVNGMHFVNRERYRENKNKCMDCLSGQKKYLCVKVI